MSTAAPVGLLLRGRWWTGTARAVVDEHEAITGMSVLMTGCPRYAGWLDVETDDSGVPVTADLRRELAAGRVPIRIGDLGQASRRHT